MPGQARKFTDAQRNAVVRAVLVEGMTQVDTIRAAEAGELIPGESFKIARGTLQGYLRRAAGDPNDGIAPEQVRAQLLSALKREIDAELPKLEGRKKIDFIAQALHAVRAATNEPRPRKPPKPDTPKPEEKAEGQEAPSIERMRDALSKSEGGVIVAANDEATRSRDGAELARSA